MDGTLFKVVVERHNSARFSGRWTAETWAKLTRLPGRYKWAGRDCVFETTGANLLHINTEFGPVVDWSEEMRTRLDAVLELEETLKKTRAAKSEPRPADARWFEFKTKPFVHQEEVFFLSRDLKAYALLMEMGTGKTKVIIDTAAHLYAEGKIDSLMIFAPNGVHRQWGLEQLKIHMPDWVQYKTYIHKSAGSDHRKLRRFLDESRDCLQVGCFNLEAMSHKSGVEAATQFMARRLCLMAIDESSLIKHAGAARTKACIKLGRAAAYRRIMSGTPITKGIEDLYAQLLFLDEDVLGYRSFYTFRNHFCRMGGFEGKQIIGYQNQDELQRRLDGISYIKMKKDCLDLPEKIYTQRQVELTPEQRKLYDELRDELVVEFADQYITAPHVLTRLLKLQQLIGNYIVDEEGLSYQVSSTNPRAEEVVKIVQEAANKTIVWARFQKDIDSLRNHLAEAKIGAVVYDGRVSNSDRTAAIEAFRTDPGIQVFLGNPAAASRGLNLEIASTVVYYSNSFDADVRWQSEDRAHRIGQKNPVLYVDLIAPKTIDSKILGNLRAKKAIAHDVLALKALLDAPDDDIVAG